VSIPSQPAIANLARPARRGEKVGRLVKPADPVPVIVRVVWASGQVQEMEGMATHWREDGGPVMVEGLRQPAAPGA
jgi:hypothetical protein